jgi:hypothetical protein
MERKNVSSGSPFEAHNWLFTDFSNRKYDRRSGALGLGTCGRHPWIRPDAARQPL